MQKINIIQFLPYFPPHKGGLETHADEWGKWWVKKEYGKVYNVITSFNQIPLSISPQGREVEQIIFEGKIIGYKQNFVENLIVPSYEIISNFPIYKFWTEEYKLVLKYLKNITSPQPSPTGEGVEQFVVLTRTRFFITSFIGGLYARKNKIKWCHVEHGSDYVKLNSKFKSIVAKVYDKLIGKWIFKNADELVGVSNACKRFINNEFLNREVKVIYRGFDFVNIDLNNIKEENLKDKFEGKIIIGFLGRLYKWKNVESLVKSYYLLDDDLKNKIQIVVIGDGEDLNRLKSMDSDNKVYFAGGKEFKNALKLQSQFDIHFHTSSPGGGLSGSLVQAMFFAKIVISTPYEGADEIIFDKKNGILLKNDSIEEIKRGLEDGIQEFEEGKSYLGENKKVIEREFMWEENIAKYYQIF